MEQKCQLFQTTFTQDNYMVINCQNSEEEQKDFSRCLTWNRQLQRIKIKPEARFMLSKQVYNKAYRLGLSGVFWPRIKVLWVSSLKLPIHRNLLKLNENVSYAHFSSLLETPRLVLVLMFHFSHPCIFKLHLLSSSGKHLWNYSHNRARWRCLHRLKGQILFVKRGLNT